MDCFKAAAAALESRLNELDADRIKYVAVMGSDLDVISHGEGWVEVEIEGTRYFIPTVRDDVVVGVKIVD